MLIGDAAGLAYAQSGEGIRPAVESGLMAAATILEAFGRGDTFRLDSYAERVRVRFGAGYPPGAASGLLPDGAVRAFGRALLRSRLFVRHVVLDRWFLHAGQPSLAPC
jgi:hypothetical protein